MFVVCTKTRFLLCVLLVCAVTATPTATSVAQQNLVQVPRNSTVRILAADCTEDAIRMTTLARNVTQLITDFLMTNENEMNTFATQTASAINGLSNQVNEVTGILRARRAAANQLDLKISDIQNHLATLQTEDLNTATMSRDLEMECQRQEKILSARKKENEDVMQFLDKLRKMILQQTAQDPTQAEKMVLFQGVAKILPNLLPAKTAKNHARELQTQMLLQSDNADQDSSEELFQKIARILDELAVQAQSGADQALVDLETSHKYCQTRDQNLRETAASLKEQISNNQELLKSTKAQAEEQKRLVVWAKVDLDILQRALDEKMNIAHSADASYISRKGFASVQLTTLNSLLHQPFCCMCNVA
eukprot:c6197_g1_i1.p1 GENE.c6197_g1_i1~~c6197_g1_i1.p1  ORF type:complete len:375 (+),score=124.86 c6197_g1_i1:38-1126(+)